MKKVFFSLALLFSAMVPPMMAQNNAQNAKQKDNAKARIEIRQEKPCLVLSTDIFISEELSVIAFFIDETTWTTLDNLLVAPKGATVKMKDSRGDIVNVALANVNSQIGLMFTSGSKHIAITKEEYEGLKDKNM